MTMVRAIPGFLEDWAANATRGLGVSMLFVLGMVTRAGLADAATPRITIISVPPSCATSGGMHGSVSGVVYSEYRVAAYIYVPGLGWYSKPHDSPFMIEDDGTWTADVNTGGLISLDSRATIFSAWLVPASYSPPRPNYRLPEGLDAFPHDVRERSGREIQFANRVWTVKGSLAPMGPVLAGPGNPPTLTDPVDHRNYYSDLASDVWSDSAGLHLTIQQHDGNWWATEVTLLGNPLGYGTYWYHTASRTDLLDVNVTFGGGFTFDDYGDEESPDGSHNREIDVGEDSRWGVATDPNTQNVKQPYDYRSENRHRFYLPDLSSNPGLTRIMVWRPESLRFVTLKGNYSPTNYPPEAVVNDYTYSHDPATGHYVPVPGREHVHFNLWLNKTVAGGAPSDGQSVEVVISDFSFMPPAVRFSPSALANISTRASVQTGDNVLIGGFIITGPEAKKVIVRAIGPSLANAGVANPLADPMLELRDSSSALLASNDNWQTTQFGDVIMCDQSADVQASGLAPSDPRESALIATLSPGAYTAIISGVGNTTGVGLAEAYDLGQATASRLANISSRSLVQTGDNVMIGGFIVGNGAGPRVIIRAIGPSLANAGVANPLADPMLELHDGNGTLIVANDNWRTDQEAEIIATGIPPSNDLESAIVRDLTPGNYTAIVRGQGNTTGVGLVEVYNLR